MGRWDTGSNLGWRDFWDADKARRVWGCGVWSRFVLYGWCDKSYVILDISRIQKTLNLLTDVWIEALIPKRIEMDKKGHNFCYFIFRQSKHFFWGGPKKCVFKKCPQKVPTKSVHKKRTQKESTKSVHKKCPQKGFIKSVQKSAGNRGGLS